MLVYMCWGQLGSVFTHRFQLMLTHTLICDFAGCQSQLCIFCSPIPDLQNGIGLMLLGGGPQKWPDVNHTPVR